MKTRLRDGYTKLFDKLQQSGGVGFDGTALHCAPDQFKQILAEIMLDEVNGKTLILVGKDGEFDIGLMQLKESFMDACINGSFIGRIGGVIFAHAVRTVSSTSCSVFGQSTLDEISDTVADHEFI